VLLGACGDDDGEATGSSSGGDPTGSWVLAEGTGPSGPVPLVDGSPVTLEVDGTMAAGSAACNRYNATIESIDDGEFSVGPAASTMRLCVEPEVMASEAAYLAAFEAVEEYRVDGDVLVLTGPDTELRFDPA